MGSYSLPYASTAPPQMMRGTMPDMDRAAQSLRRQADLSAVDRIRALQWDAYARRDVPQVLNLDTAPRRGPGYDRAWGAHAQISRAPLLFVDRAQPINARGLDRDMQARADALLDQSAYASGLVGAEYRVDPLKEPPTHLRPFGDDRFKYVTRDAPYYAKVPVVPGETRVFVLGDPREWQRTVGAYGGSADEAGRVAGLDADFLRHHSDLFPLTAAPPPRAAMSSARAPVLWQGHPRLLFNQYRDPAGQ